MVQCYFLLRSLILLSGIVINMWNVRMKCYNGCIIHSWSLTCGKGWEVKQMELNNGWSTQTAYLW